MSTAKLPECGSVGLDNYKIFIHQRNDVGEGVKRHLPGLLTFFQALVGLGNFNQSFASEHKEEAEDQHSQKKDDGVVRAEQQYFLPGGAKNFLHGYGDADTTSDITDLIALVGVTVEADLPDFQGQHKPHKRDLIVHSD